MRLPHIRASDMLDFDAASLNRIGQERISTFEVVMRSPFFIGVGGVVSADIAARFNGSLIPCGVDLRLFRDVGRQHAREKLGLDEEKRLVLF